MNRTDKKRMRRKLSIILKIFAILITSLVICVTTYGIYLTKKAQYAASQSYEELEERNISPKREAKVEPTLVIKELKHLAPTPYYSQR